MISDIYSRLDSMSIEELRNLNKAVIATIKSKRTLKGQLNKVSLSVGDKVCFYNGKKKLKINGEILEIKRTRAIVRQDNALGTSKWDVPFDMLSKVEPKFNPATGVIE